MSTGSQQQQQATPSQHAATPVTGATSTQQHATHTPQMSAMPSTSHGAAQTPQNTTSTSTTTQNATTSAARYVTPPAGNTAAATRLGDELWRASASAGQRVNGDLFVLTYGALVAQLVRDLGTGIAVSEELMRMGRRMGTRLVEDVLARSQLTRCGALPDTANVIALVGFKMYLGISPKVTNWSPDFREFSLILDDNPLAQFVELPDNKKVRDGLWYSNILCGAISGALEAVNIEVDATFIQDRLRGDPETEIRVKLIRYINEEIPISDE